MPARRLVRTVLVAAFVLASCAESDIAAPPPTSSPASSPADDSPPTTPATLPSVVVAGDWLPKRILGRCYALCASVRMVAVALRAARDGPDVVVVDQVATAVAFIDYENELNLREYAQANPGQGTYLNPKPT